MGRLAPAAPPILPLVRLALRDALARAFVGQDQVALRMYGRLSPLGVSWRVGGRSAGGDLVPGHAIAEQSRDRWRFGWVMPDGSWEPDEGTISDALAWIDFAADAEADWEPAPPRAVGGPAAHGAHKGKRRGTGRMRFWEFVAPMTEGAGCWEWMGSATQAGCYAWDGARMVPAARLSWEIHFGPLPPGTIVKPACGNAFCVKPWHLERMTRSECMTRAHRLACERGHPREGNTVVVRRRGRPEERWCRVCNAMRVAARKRGVGVLELAEPFPSRPRTPQGAPAGSGSWTASFGSGPAPVI